MRLRLLCAAALAACGGADSQPVPEPTLPAPPAARPNACPNIVVVLSDDQRYDTLGCTGSAFMTTPHIDRLAAEGALFTRAYVTTSLCCPARASLLMGQYLHATGIHDNDASSDWMERGTSFPELLQAAGYATGFFGKWHVFMGARRGAQPGFDRWVSFAGQGEYENETFDVDGETRTLAGYNTDVLTRLATDWMRAERAQPFALILSLKNLHRPYVAQPRHRGKLAGVPFEPPASFDDPEESLPALVVEARRSRALGGAHDELARGYHELAFSVDDTLGAVLETLDAIGASDTTLVVFTSDGGFLWGEHGLYRKASAYEPSIHVPLIARYPAEIPAGTEVEQLALNVDLAPTFLDLAGVAAPAAYQGASLRTLWRDAAPPWRARFLYASSYPRGGAPDELAVHDGRFKYVRYRGAPFEERLYDLATDPDERVDFTAREPERLADMRAALRELVRELDAPDAWLE